MILKGWHWGRFRKAIDARKFFLLTCTFQRCTITSERVH